MFLIVAEQSQFFRLENAVYFITLPFLVRKIFTFYINDVLNSVALVRERTIPTERPSPVGEVSANVCG